MTVLDWIATFVLLFFLVRGYRKGLIYTVIHLVSFALCTIATFLLLPWVRSTVSYQRAVTTMTRAIQETVPLDKTLLGFVCAILTGFLLFLVLRVCISLVGRLLGGVAKVPVIKQVNKLLGAVFGLVFGLAVILALLGIFRLVQPAWSEAKIFLMIEQSLYVRAMYENNVLLQWIGR